MTIDYLLKMDRIARDAGTREPDDVLESMGYIFTDPGRSVDGFIMKRKGSTFYGVNQGITGLKYDFCVMHEGFHGLCKHYEHAGFLSPAGAHMDIGLFSDYKNVAVTERDANIGSADFIIDTQTALEMLGYDSEDVAAYRADLESFEQHVRDYEWHFEVVSGSGNSDARIRRMIAYKRKLARMYQELQEQANDIANSGYCLTYPEIAKYFGVPEYIIGYKVEALRIRNYDIAPVELPSFGKVFSNWQ